ncbi:DNA-binding protein [Faecalimicrobium sp. JNUCC 81]
MKGNERLDKFLELQNKGVSIDDIAKELGIVAKTLKAFLNKKGYKLENERYILKDKKEINQISFTDINSAKKENSKKKVTGKKTTAKKEEVVKLSKKKNLNKDVNTSKTTPKKTQPKKDRKINITQEDMDKLCEVYDWYMQVKDYRAVKPKKNNKKDINIDKRELKDLKSATIRVDKKTWEDFERICSNSQFSKSEILTQALNDFMNEYKHLL